MIQVPEAIKELYHLDTCKKNIRIHFPNYERQDICNDLIVKDSVSFTESLCSQDTLKFGLCEASVFECEVVGVGNIKGARIEVSCEVFCDSTITGSEWKSDLMSYVYAIPYGAFIVDTCDRQADMNHRKIVAYGGTALYDFINISLAYGYRNATKPLSSWIAIIIQSTDLLDNESESLLTLRDMDILDGNRIYNYAQKSSYNGYIYTTYYNYFKTLDEYNDQTSYTCSRIFTNQAMTTPYAIAKNTIGHGSFFYPTGKEIIDNFNDLIRYENAKFVDFMDILESVQYELYNIIPENTNLVIRNTSGIYKDDITITDGSSIAIAGKLGLLSGADGRKNQIYPTSADIITAGRKAYYSGAKAVVLTDYFPATGGLYIKSDDGSSSIQFSIPSEAPLFYSAAYYIHQLGVENDYSLALAECESMYEVFYEAERSVEPSDYKAYGITDTPYGANIDMRSIKRGYYISNNETVPLNLQQYTISKIELKGVFCRKRRNDETELVNIKRQFGLNPSTSCYPSSSLYPEGVTGGKLLPEDYRSCWYKDVYSVPFGAVYCEYTNTSEIDTFYMHYLPGFDANTPDGDYLIYDFSDNELIVGNLWTENQIKAYCQTIADNIEGVQYMPVDFVGRGLPYVEAGDTFEILTKSNESITTIVLNRTITGEQTLTDSYKSVG